MLVHVDLVLAGKEGPDSDVKLSSLKKQRPLNVFLDDTAVKLGSRIDEML